MKMHWKSYIINNTFQYTVFLFNTLTNIPIIICLKKERKEEATQKKLVQKPFGERFSVDNRKFLAATFTSISILPKCLKVDSTALSASSCFYTSPSNPTA